MRDPEFISLRNRFFTGVLIALLFSVPLFIFLYKSYSNSDAMTMINKKKTFVMLVVSNDCKSCELVDDKLKDNGIDAVKVNSDTNKDYDEIMAKMNIINKREKFPIIVYVEEGNMKANLFDVDSEQSINEFIKFHGLTN